jgi:hypothetical protein
VYAPVWIDAAVPGPSSDWLTGIQGWPGIQSEAGGDCGASEIPCFHSFTPKTRPSMDRIDISFTVASIVLIVIALLEIIPRLVRLFNTIKA